MSFPRYPIYKPSGVDWLAGVPAHWAIRPLKYIASLLTEKAESRDNPIALENIESWTGRLIPTATQFAGEGTAFDTGDILFGKLRPYLAKVHLAAGRGQAVGDFHVLRPVADLSFGRYLLYQLLSDTFIDVINGSTFGSKMPRASWESLGAMPVLLPERSEQVNIAAFLDLETAKIDALVAEQERLIELLKEKRQAVISHAVTKGLNPDAPMKDSGIEWLGLIPATWTVARLKHLSPSITVGIVVEPSSYLSDDGFPFIYGGDIREGVIDWQNSRRISPEASSAVSKTMLRAGDLLTVRVGAPGVTAVVPEECAGGNCASVMLVRKGDFHSGWLCFLMNARVVRFQVEVVQYGAAQEQFNIAHAVNFWLPTPPRAEQDEIADFLAASTRKFDALVVEAQRSITLLRERRTSLISAAVTGQIDVRPESMRSAA